MKKWIYSALAIFFLSFSSVYAADSDFDTAKNIIENWFAAMKNQQVEQAADYLSPEFTSIHTDGIVRNKAEEIDLIKNLHMTSYHLTDFKVVPSGDVLVVTYKDQGSEKIDNKKISKKIAGRMAVLQKKDDKWLILAYANLDKI